MAVENMKLLSAIGKIKDIDVVSDEIVKCGCVHAVNSIDDIKQYVKDDEGYIRQHKNKDSRIKFKDDLINIMDMLKIKMRVNHDHLAENIPIDKISNDVALIYSEVLKYKNELDKAEDDIAKMTESIDNLKDVIDVEYPLSEIKELKYFKFSMGRLRKEFYKKLKENIENIPSIIYEVSKRKHYIAIITFIPFFKIKEAEEIFKSLGYEEIMLPENAEGVPKDIIKEFYELINLRKKTVIDAQASFKKLKEQYEDKVLKYYSLILKYEKMANINENAAYTDHVFYISGWVPESRIHIIKEGLKKIDDKLVLAVRDHNEAVKLTPPTRLVNNSFSKPFEFIVNMYGTPEYKEFDPTFFVAASYTIMFGIMFGDIGHGLILLLGGLYLYFLKKSYDLGGIILRVGISSIIFGFLYGSVFGSDKIINPVLIRPLDNINTMLIFSVAFGIILSSIGYIINISNCIKLRNIEEGVFGSEGLIGFIFYLTVLFLVYFILMHKSFPIPAPLAVTVLAVLLLLNVFKQPLGKLIEGRRPLHKDSISDYYVESVFGVIETLLSMVSKTISFVRLGAFAINHAGLSIAFFTISNMLKNNAQLSIFVLILGNIIIIGLEGLVVFIQGMRLEYYELFSRFYRGDGISYEPVCISDEQKN